MNHDPNLGEPKESAANYLAGFMSATEQVQFEAHVEAGCDACREELRQVTEALSRLMTSVSPVAPDPTTRNALLQRVAASRPTAASPSPLKPLLETPAPMVDTPTTAVVSPMTQRTADGKWTATAVPGVSIRVLYVDKANDQFSAFVRMEPGASYPPHLHSGLEHCLVLEGELEVGNETLRPGDYQVAPAGSHHGIQQTREGCLLFITSSLHDEFL